MRYEVLEHTSDVKLLIHGSSLGELLENAGFAMFDQMTDLSLVEAADPVEITATGGMPDELVMAWLRELLYWFHVERYLFKEFSVTELQGNSVKAVVKGEKINLKRHVFEVEIKGATYHNFEVKEVDGRWQATVLFDV